MEKSELRRKVKLFLAQSELGQEQFADKIGISRSRFNGWLNGHFRVRPTIRNKMTQALGIGPIEKGPPFTPLDRVIDHLNKANRELNSAKSEIEEMSSYLMRKITDLVRFKNFLKEINQKKKE